MSTISLCMIVKNEEDFLLDCLKSFEDVVDEIIIVDTGSTDKTLEIAKNFDAQIYNFKWVNDFSLARNESLKYATKDWILIADADNTLDENSIPLIKSLVEKKDVIAYFIDEYSSFEYEEKELGLFDSIYRKLFFFRNHLNIKFEGIIHEQVYQNISKIIDEKPDYKILNSNIKYFHYGYTIEGIEKRIERNTKLTELLLSQKDLPLDWMIYHKTGLAELKMKIKKYDEAKEIFLDVLYKAELIRERQNENFKPTFGSYFGLAYIYSKEKKFQEAINYLKEAITHYPDAPFTYYYIGIMYLKIKNYLEAINYFEACIEFGKKGNFNKFIGFNLDVLDVFPYLGLAFCYAKLGGVEDAKLYLNKCLELKPNFFQAKEALKILSTVKEPKFKF